VWINLGPLLWHFENSPTKSAKGEGSIELSLDEVKELARAVGFDIHVRSSIHVTSREVDFLAGREDGRDDIYRHTRGHVTASI
jgi:hypothetical protein